MRRTDRLFEIVQMFRSGRTLTAASIAARLEVSQRTIYRDLDTLVASGVPVEGERGVGYILRAPIFLPPLTLGEDEVDALHFALDLAGRTGDPALADAIERVRGKVDAALPPGRQARAFARALSSHARSDRLPVLGTLRAAIREGRTVSFDYDSLPGAEHARGAALAARVVGRGLDADRLVRPARGLPRLSGGSDRGLREGRAVPTRAGPDLCRLRRPDGVAGGWGGLSLIGGARPPEA